MHDLFRMMERERLSQNRRGRDDYHECPACGLRNISTMGTHCVDCAALIAERRMGFWYRLRRMLSIAPKPEPRIVATRGYLPREMLPPVNVTVHVNQGRHVLEDVICSHCAQRLDYNFQITTRERHYRCRPCGYDVNIHAHMPVEQALDFIAEAGRIHGPAVNPDRNNNPVDALVSALVETGMPLNMETIQEARDYVDGFVVARPSVVMARRETSYGVQPVPGQYRMGEAGPEVYVAHDTWQPIARQPAEPAGPKPRRRIILDEE